MKNCASKVKLPKGAKKEMLVWNELEIKRFLEFAKENRYYIAFELALLTGMRQGEILGLRWKDINLDKGYLVINQTLSHDGKTFLVCGKTKSSRRNIQHPNSTIDGLKRHKIIVNKEKENDIYTNNDLVVCTQVGTPLNPANLRRSFNNLIKTAQVPQIRFHDLRHTHATLLLSKGVNIKVISERLGHSNIKVTLDTYSHVLPTMQEDAIKKLEGII